MVCYRVFLRLAISIILCATIQACSTTDMTNSMKDFMGMSDGTISEKDYETVKFEKAINRSFESQLTGKKFKFTARYKGTVPNPEPGRRVRDFTNLKMCDLNKSEVCTDLIVIKSSDAQTVFDLSDNQTVDVYGSLLEVTGMSIGANSSLDFAANNMKAPYSYIRADKVVPAGRSVSSDSSVKNKSSSQSSSGGSTKSSLDVSSAQQILNRNGYYCGTPDGKMGQKTKQAITKFQHDNGLAETGSLNTETRAKLREGQ